jgi:hypothetical protein
VASRNAEIDRVVATSRPYLDLPLEELERLFDEALDDAELGGLPHRGTEDERSFWQSALDRLKKDIAKQGEAATTATLVLAASQAVDWAHSIGLDMTGYNIPIAIFVAMAVKAVWAQMNSSESGIGDNEPRDR